MQNLEMRRGNLITRYFAPNFYTLFNSLFCFKTFRVQSSPIADLLLIKMNVLLFVEIEIRLYYLIVFFNNFIYENSRSRVLKTEIEARNNFALCMFREFMLPKKLVPLVKCLF